MIQLLVILGPTAAGKSRVAVEVAGLLNGEVVVGDSMQVYRGMDIGTAKLSEQEKVSSNGCYISHHLVDIVAPDQPFSVAEYQKLAWAAITDIASRGKIPILAGGTGLYLRAVTDPCYDFPSISGNSSLRQQLYQEAETYGRIALHRRLAEVDPVSARRLHPNDLRRVVRALEIYYLSGQPASSVQSGQAAEPRYHYQVYGLNLPRPMLYRAIDRRAEEMLAAGWVEEVRALLNRGYDRNLPAMQGLGYRHIVNFLLGKSTWLEMVRLIQRDTRHFAKRQLTWFRRDQRVVWFEVNDYSDHTELAGDIVKDFGRTKKSVVEYLSP